MMSHAHIHKHLLINSYGSWLRRRFGCRVSKVNVDGGFTCPNRDGSKGTGGCIFCDNAAFSPDGARPDILLEQQIADGMAYHRTRLGSEQFIIYFQKFTNTYAPVEKLRDLYGRALASPDVLGISVGTRPDALGDDALDLLAEIGRNRYVCVELGLQSMDASLLRWMNRGHTLAEYLEAVERVAERGLHVCTHLIYGFPGETRSSFLKTADLLAGLPVDSVKIHQLHAVRGTRLARMCDSGELRLISHGEYVAGVCDFLERLPSRIAIQRLYGSAPLGLLVAPCWGLKNNQMWYSIVNELKRRGSWQGCRLADDRLLVADRAAGSDDCFRTALPGKASDRLFPQMASFGATFAPQGRGSGYDAQTVHR
jgi:radical SAM protein (TIGR01212 family)